MIAKRLRMWRKYIRSLGVETIQARYLNENNPECGCFANRFACSDATPKTVSNYNSLMAWLFGLTVQEYNLDYGNVIDNEKEELLDYLSFNTASRCEFEHQGHAFPVDKWDARVENVLQSGLAT